MMKAFTLANAGRTAFLSLCLLNTGNAGAQLIPLRPQDLAIVRAQQDSRTGAAADYLASMRPVLGLDGSHQFALRASHTDQFGQTHSRFQQRYKSLRLWGAEAITHFDLAGVPLAMSDDLQRNIELDTTAGIDTPQAIDAVMQDLRRSGLLAGAAPVSATSELLVFPVTETIRIARTSQPATINAAEVRQHPTRHHLAYHVQARFLADGGEAHFSTMIDAHSGAILARWNDLRTAASVGSGQSQYSGSVSLNTNSTGAGYELRDTTRGVNGKFGNNVVVNLNHANSGLGTLYTDADNLWGDGKDYVDGSDTTLANGETAAVDAAYGLQAT
jgi:Zn-dependent metalloprotease